MKHPETIRPQAGRHEGFTLIEVIVSLTIVVVAVGGLVASLTASSRLDRATQERSVAINASRQLLEEVKVQFPTVDEYVAFYQGANTVFPLDMLQLPLIDRLAASQAYVAAGFPGTAVWHDYLATTSTASPNDRTLDRLQNAQATVGVVKLNDSQMNVSITITWTGANGPTTTTLQTDMGK